MPVLAFLAFAAALGTASPGAAAPLPEFDGLWNYDKPKETEARFRELVPAAEKSRDAKYHAELLTQIARTQGLQGRFDEAHGTLDRVQKMLRPGMDRQRVRYLLERGRALNSSGKPSEAKPLFIEAWDLARKAGEDPLAIDAAHMVAIVEKPAEALKWLNEALVVARSSSDPKSGKWLGALYNNIGWTYHDDGQYQKALDIFKQALDWRIGQKREPEINVAKYSVARALRSLGRLDEALAMGQEVEQANVLAGTPDGYVFEEIAECLLAKGRPAEARPYFAKAHAELAKDPWMASNEAKRLERLKSLGAADPK